MPKKILLADDSITIQKVVELTFSDGDYEVTAVNNGAKAVQKLAEMRPDIILSDIIMPEKNGYEVCEYVKSHPDFRNIPVVLLTGTFEPFDPDRAEKAGCDAVVTKPFESQSLIHKVEELIAQTQSAAPAEESAPEAASPWMDEPPAPDAATAAETGVFTPPSPEAVAHANDIFNEPAASASSNEMPFETPQASPFGEPPAPEAFSTETRAFPRMSLDELQQAGSTNSSPTEPAASATPTWSMPGETPAAADEAPAWPDMSAPTEEKPMPAPSFGSLEAPQTQAKSPFDEQPADLAGETRGFPKMSFDDFPPVASENAGEASAPEMPSWDKPETPAFGEEAPAFGGETRAFPKMSFDDFSQNAPAPAEEAPQWNESPAPAFGGEPAAFEEPPAEAEPLSTEPEAPAYSAETSAFPKMAFDDFQQQPSATEPEPEPQAAAPAQFETESAPEPESSEPLPWDEPPAPAADSFWSPAAERPTFDAPASESETSSPEPFSSATPEDLPPAYEPSVESEQPESREEEEVRAGEPSEDAWASAAADTAEAEAEADEPVVPPPALAPDAPAMPIAAAHSGELTEEQIDRIARRVVELMSEQVVRNIAWEVIPDMAEMVVKERIRQLESEA